VVKTIVDVLALLQVGSDVEVTSEMAGVIAHARGLLEGVIKAESKYGAVCKPERQLWQGRTLRHLSSKPLSQAPFLPAAVV
jgi:hypothetical protein